MANPQVVTISVTRCFLKMQIAELYPRFKGQKSAFNRSTSDSGGGDLISHFGETLAYSRKPNFSNMIHMARFALFSLCCLSAFLFFKHLSPTDLDLVTFPWRIHCLLSFLPHLATYAVPSARHVFASLFNLINYLSFKIQFK